MSIINGRPGGDDDDDFVVDMEENDSDFSLPDDEEIEESKPAPVDPYNLADEIEDEEEQERSDKAAAAGGQDGDAEGDDEEDEITQARMIAEEATARAVTAQTNSIARDAENRWNLVQSELSKAEISLGSLGMHIENAHAALAQAKDSGDTRAELDLMSRLRELEGLKSQIELAKGQTPTREQIFAKARADIAKVQADAHRSRGRPAGDGVVSINPMADRWAKQNTWMKTNKDAGRYVVSQSQSLVREGWDQNTPGFYAELSRRVAGAFPGVKATPLIPKKKGPTKSAQKQRSSVSPGGRSSMTSGAPAPKQMSGSRYTITISDQQAMRRMNLDPSNVKHRKEFARSRIETGRRA